MKQEFCEYCGVELRRGHNRTVDHLVPRSKGGSNAKENRVLACSFCNLLKGDRMFADLASARRWMLKRAKLTAKRLMIQVTKYGG